MAVLNVNVSSILKNLDTVKELCKRRGCILVPVTKICRSEPIIVEAFKGHGIDIIADSSLVSLSHLKSDVKRFLSNPAGYRHGLQQVFYSRPP